ncbi:MAG: phosphodiesterase [Firmicutes bacterium]|nr:phosphodiesterase [Bacillota bacterium]
MKILIASDIHGSAKFSEALLENINAENPDKILLLGDLLYHGPRNALPDDYDTKRTMEILNSLRSKITAVRGNCDSEVDQMVLNFPIMNSYEQIEIDGIKFFATHGHHYNPDNLPPFVEFDVLLNGHTHISALKDFGDYYYANPGSASIPKGETVNSYMIYENKQLTIKNLFTKDKINTIKIEHK